MEYLCDAIDGQALYLDDDTSEIVLSERICTLSAPHIPRQSPPYIKPKPRAVAFSEIWGVGRQRHSYADAVRDFAADAAWRPLAVPTAPVCIPYTRCAQPNCAVLLREGGPNCNACNNAVNAGNIDAVNIERNRILTEELYG